MSAESTQSKDPFASLRKFDGDSKAFWTRLVDTLRALSGAAAVMVAVRTTTGEDVGAWRLLGKSLADGTIDYFPGSAVRPMMEAAAFGERLTAQADTDKLRGRWCAGPLQSGGDAQQCVVVLYLAENCQADLASILTLLAQAADLPEVYLLWQKLLQREQDVHKLVGALDLLGRLRDMPGFESASLYVCNDIAKNFHCQQVALAWKKGDYFRVQAISHTPRFEAKMAMVQAMEQVAEEAADQGEDVNFPPIVGQQSVTKVHQSYADAHKLNRVTTVCLWHNGQVTGVLLLQDHQMDFSVEQMRSLRVIADQIVEPLYYAYLRSGWVGKRIARAGRDWAKNQWNLEYPWIKLSVVLATLALGVLIFGGMTYRVEAPFVLRTADELLLPAPFEGFMEVTRVRTGDAVASGEVLAQLDRSELQLQEVALMADRSRFISEAERARGRNELAEMRVAQAQRDQTEAALALVRAQLAAAAIRAPFDAIVADDFGLPMRSGAPVRRGDILLRLARMDALFLEIDLPERHVHHLRLQAPGEFAFASRPDFRFPFGVDRIEPMGIPIEAGNIFRVRGDITVEEVPDWWRPGMTGVVKIEVGRKSFFVDFDSPSG
ncbi:MAG: efflux RND transporter periplasmic adaptor subunit [Verrucomicrobia bacterium]|nr:efflux RND transporter periplasmic adaptor subunit [Verrucomicrobiota bacterium]